MSTMRQALAAPSESGLQSVISCPSLLFPFCITVTCTGIVLVSDKRPNDTVQHSQLPDVTLATNNVEDQIQARLLSLKTHGVQKSWASTITSIWALPDFFWHTVCFQVLYFRRKWNWKKRRIVTRLLIALTDCQLEVSSSICQNINIIRKF